MSMSANEIAQLKKLISIAEKLIKQPPTPKRGRPAKIDNQKPVSAKRTRRSGKKLLTFRKMLISERKRGASVANLARQHGVSLANIYQL